VAVEGTLHRHGVGSEQEPAQLGAELVAPGRSGTGGDVAVIDLETQVVLGRDLGRLAVEREGDGVWNRPSSVSMPRSADG